MIHWTELHLHDADGTPITNTKARRAYLQEFRDTGAIHTVFFARIGAPHEDPEDASTWGPESPKNVDWFGFHRMRSLDQ